MLPNVAQMDLFYEGINFYQSVAYKLDTKVLGVIKPSSMVGHTVGNKCPHIKCFLLSLTAFAKNMNFIRLIKMIGKRSGKRNTWTQKC